MKPRIPLQTSALTLRDFLHRSKVLKSYRDFMRELQGMDQRVANELRASIREGFQKNKGETNRANIKAQLTEAGRQLQFLRTYVGTARWKMREAPAGSQDTGGIPNADTGSWVGTGDPDDIRGRTGEVWPWQGNDEESDKMDHRPLHVPKR